MADLIGPKLDDLLLDRLSGKDVGAQFGKTIVVLTTDEEGFPHPALLTYHSVVAKGESVIDLAIGKDSHSSANLKRNGALTLIIADTGLNYYLKGTSKEMRDEMHDVSFMSLFRMQIHEVWEDRAAGVITSGITVSRPELAPLLKRAPLRREITEIMEKIFHEVQREPVGG